MSDNNNLSNDIDDKYRINEIKEDKNLKELCADNPDLSKQIDEEINEFVEKTGKEIEQMNPFEKEEALKEEFSNTDKESFNDNWNDSSSFIENTYDKDYFNTEFYHKEFEKSINEKNDKDNIKFESVKEKFIEDWDSHLTEKKLHWELDVIDRRRKEFLEKLYKNLEDVKQLQEIIDPFTNDFGRLWDMSKSNWKKANFDTLRKYSELLQKNKSLQKLAEMLGKMRQAEKEYEEEMFSDMRSKPAWKVDYAAKAELVGIHESDDINSILPIEAALLADETTELLFYKKFSEKKLQTFEYQAKERIWESEEFLNKRKKEKEEKKGPYIVCIDTSGSMSGTPEKIAKTLCFALLKISIKEKRKCYLISFSTGIETIEITDFKNDQTKFLDFLSMGFYGGTDATLAVLEALRMLEKNDYKKADVIMVSDFIMGNFDAQTINKIRAAKEKETRFHSLVIGSSGNNYTIKEFDNNWYYNMNNDKCQLRLVKDLNSTG